MAWVFLIASASVTGAAEVAAPADGGEGSFLDSFGINMQLDRSDHAARKQMLLELGIRHNRCSTGVQGVSTVDATILGRITDLAASGVKATLLWSRWSSLTEMVSTTASLGSAVVAVEGPNETNLAAENFTYNGSGFPVGSRAIQRDLYAAFKADDRVRNLPVYLTTVAPTLSYADLGNMETYGGSRNMDFGNMHCYYVVSHLLGDKLETYHIANARLAAPTLPLVCTETGWPTSNVSESAQAKYALRAFCEGFRRQVRRTYWFALADDSNGLYGLLRADLTRKPSFTALRDLIAMLRDPGGSAPYPLGSLALTFADAPASLRHLLLRDSSGTWSIIVWNEVLSYDNGADLVVAPVPVVVGFGASFAQVTVHQPMEGTAAVASAAGVNQLAVDVPDHPLVIRLRPATAPAIATAPANQTVIAPATATFTVAASGFPTPTFQWQSAPSGSSIFAGISGATSASYTTAATSTGMSGVKYRCVATNSAGSATSAVAVLTVQAAPAPELDIARSGVAIVDGGADTLVVSVARTAQALTHVLSNNGTSALGVTVPVSVAGASNCTVSVTTQPSTSIPAGGFANLVLKVTPTAAGNWSCQVSIINTDGTRNPYDWSLSGTAVASGSAPTNASGSSGGGRRGCGFGQSLALIVMFGLSLVWRPRRGGFLG